MKLAILVGILFGAHGFDYKTDKIRGVNIGGWLVLEPWITPSLFNQFKGNGELAVDEYTFSKILGEKEAKKRLEEHWNSFVTNDDFRILRDAGINHVRIPVGYWAYNRTADEPWAGGSAQQLERGVQLAKANGLKVMIDIHGAPLSQNGFDNSGQAGPIKFLSDGMSGLRMLDVLEKVAKKFTTGEFKDTVTSIQLVNEPASWGLDMDKLKQFYEDGYNAIRKYSSDVQVTFHDAFRDVAEWEYLSQKKHVLLDTHIYNVFDESMVRFSQDQHLERTCTFSGKLAQSKSKLPTFVGEWSLATTDCTLYLNGMLKGSRLVGNFKNHDSPRLNPDYDYNNDKCAQYDHINKFPQGHKAFLKRFFDRQIGVWENAGSGWFFWNFKAENSPEWNFILGVQQGWIRIPDKTELPC